MSIYDYSARIGKDISLSKLSTLLSAELGTFIDRDLDYFISNLSQQLKERQVFRYIADRYEFLYFAHEGIKRTIRYKFSDIDIDKSK